MLHEWGSEGRFQRCTLPTMVRQACLTCWHLHTIPSSALICLPCPLRNCRITDECYHTQTSMWVLGLNNSGCRFQTARTFTC